VPEEDITDPRVVPRWVESGVSGLARAREWDATTALEVPELAELPISDLSFRVLDDGAVVRGEGEAPDAALDRLAASARRIARAPLEAHASRRGQREWALAVRELRLESVELPPGLGATEISVATSPDGGTTYLVDGEEVDSPAPELLEAFDLLERAGGRRFPAFVARAELVAPGRWGLTIDPL
jgi:hypothetical protein